MEAKQTVLERLNQREAKRVQELQQSNKTKKDTNAATIEIEAFLTSFNDKTNDIEAALEAVEAPENINNKITDINADIEELQKLVGKYTLFITEYNAKKCQDIIKKLQSKLNEYQVKYAPKPKFGFRKTGPKKASIAKVNPNDEVDTNFVSKKWEDVSFFGFRSRTSENLKLSSNEVYQKDVSLSFLVNCTVVIKGTPATLHLDNLQGCIILCGPVSTSIFLDNCTDCKFVIACQQMRMHFTKNCDIYLHVTSKGIIEDCSGIGTAPYNLTYDGIEEDFVRSTLDRNRNNWNNLDDFNWLASDVPSPNWHQIIGVNLVSDWTAVMSV